ncbi:MAG TPA: hypothetical protein DCY76_05845 [Flavobacteriales bacterium]|nr:hypothetical protein [Flavobacteriales bacterium]
MVGLRTVAGTVVNSPADSCIWPLRRVALFAKFRVDCTMRNPLQVIFLLLFSMLFVGCSIQKRTLMPGYHIERVGGQGLHASEAAPSASVEALEEMQWAMAGTLPHDLPAAALNSRPYGIHNPAQVSRIRPISPKRIAAETSTAELVEPMPWDETYQEQKLLGNIALVALVLSVLLLATGAPVLLIRAAQVSGIVAFILNRRKRKEVLDIKELNGYDVTEERKQFRTSNRLLGGAAFVVILASIALSILAVLAFIALID